MSNVLSGKVFVRPATREAVLRAVGELGYQMNVAARSLRTGRTGFITLAVPDLSIDYFAQLARSVLLEAERVGWAVSLLQTDSRRDRELDILSGALRQLSDGLIFQPHALDPTDREHLVTNQPMVLLGERIFAGSVDHITMSNAAAAREATQHLLNLGRRQIAVIGPDNVGHSTTAAALRLDGYRQALDAAGVPFREELIAQAPIWKQAAGAAGVDGLLQRGVHFDGLFCFNDTLAFGALHSLHQRGLQVPRDVAVIGFGNVTAAAYSYPPLTTIDPGGVQIARRAVQLLALRTQNEQGGEAAHSTVDYALISRASA